MTSEAGETARGFWAEWGSLLRSGWRGVRAGGGALLCVMLAFHLVLLVLAAPLLSWLFREALWADGMLGLDFAATPLTGGILISLILIVVIGVLAFWLTALQAIAIIAVLQAASAGERVTVRALGASLAGNARRLLRVSSWPLAIVLLLLMPVTGFGFGSVLTQGIAIPQFVSSEVMKNPITAPLWVALLLLLLWLTLRLSASLPVFATNTVTSGRAAMRQSWRLTRGKAGWSLAAAFGTVVLGAGVATFLLVVAAVGPVALSDRIAPHASPVVAALCLGAAQVLGALLVAWAVAFFTAIVLGLMRHPGSDLAAVGSAVGASGDTAALTLGSGQRRPRRWLPATLLVAFGVCAALLLGVSHVAMMQRVAEHPESLVLGHRGYVAGGVENTLSALEAASSAGVDAVEMDVMQTADKGFVVIHDFNLGRLAGQDRDVKDLTVDELTRITVRDDAGHRDMIPSLEAYVTRADQLGMPLLMEIKMGGLDSEDHVELLIKELEGLGAFDATKFHSLDHASVERLKRLRPDATVGYIMPFAGEGMPRTSADFVVVEEDSADQDMQDAAQRAGKGFVVWTVDEAETQRELLRRNVSAIISDQPVSALDARSAMDAETGLAGRLYDALFSLVVVF